MDTNHVVSDVSHKGGHESKQDRVIIFDTTSRDGKQSPGCQHSPADTEALAHRLATMKVDIMEAGFAIASEADFESVQRVAQNVKGIRCCSLARAREDDIQQAARALEKAVEPPRIHTFIASSDVHLQDKLHMSPDKVVEVAVAAVRKARRYVEDVEFSPEDSARTGFDFLKRIVAAVIEAGATTVNIPDTVGYSVGREYGTMIARLIKEIPAITEKGIIISTHCHNDLAHAVANTLSGLEYGARQAEVTMLGIGERAGNAQLESVVMALKTRQDYYGLDVAIDTSQLGPTARFVSMIIGKPIDDTKPIVGANAFAHGAGIHQHGKLASDATYEIMKSDDVGWAGEAMPLISQSGRHGLKSRLGDLGYADLSAKYLDRLYQKFTALADTKTYVYNEDLHMLMQETKVEEQAQSEQWLLLKNLDYHKMGNQHSATIVIKRNGTDFEATGYGNGPVAAVWDAISCALLRGGLWPEQVILEKFDIGKNAGGVEALGVTMVTIKQHDKIGYGRGSDTDIITAYAKAQIAALNHLIHFPVSLLQKKAV